MIMAALMAEVDVNLFEPWTKPGSIVGQLAIVVGAVLAVGFVIFLWAAFVRKPRHHKPSHHSASDYTGGGSARHKRSSPLSRMFRKKRHKRRHSRERPTNPTLAEIGGLPPRRDEHPPS